jgi:hypothetical protein
MTDEKAGTGSRANDCSGFIGSRVTLSQDTGCYAKYGCRTSRYRLTDGRRPETPFDERQIQIGSSRSSSSCL